MSKATKFMCFLILIGLPLAAEKIGKYERYESVFQKTHADGTPSLIQKEAEITVFQEKRPKRDHSRDSDFLVRAISSSINQTLSSIRSKAQPHHQ
jgi:hypothetical protein